VIDLILAYMPTTELELTTGEVGQLSCTTSYLRCPM